MAEEHSHRWSPIELPRDPRVLSSEALHVLRDLWTERALRLRTAGRFDELWQRIVRRWSIETGIIEHLYDLSLGATEMLVQHGFSANLIHHGDADTDPERLIAILDDHRGGLTMVMDLVGGKRELTVGWIKELHVLLCRHQPIVSARTPLGDLVQIPFEHGVYKRLPNNPTLEQGVHEYCPPEHVAAEMERLVAGYHAMLPELADVRAAWLHHAFTRIHPFQDGNGRVARALASVAFIRAGLFPLTVDRSQRDTEYMPRLRAADAGNLQPLVQLFVDCQQSALLEALSSAVVVGSNDRSFEAVVVGARERLERRRLPDEETKTRLAGRMAELSARARARLHETAERLHREIRGTNADVDTRGPQMDGAQPAFEWRAQLLALAKVRRYVADLNTLRVWDRLTLQNGLRTEFVVVLHWVGPDAQKAFTAGAFVVHRASEADVASEESTVVLDTAPLIMAVDESVDSQQRRFDEWFSRAIVLGLSEWERTL